MIEKERWGIIYNPKAGTRRVQKRWNKIREYMETKGVVFDYLQSEGYGSIERLSRMLANNGYRTIVIVGGDGAMNDAINGIMLSDAPEKNEISLGIIPNGIGNDYASYWGFDVDEYKEAIDTIIEHRTRKVDVGICSYTQDGNEEKRYFLNAANIGLGARIVQISNGTYRFWGFRTISFFASMLLMIFERKLNNVHLKINGEHIRGKIMTVCIGSARGYGLTPSAVPYNGWLDVSIIYRPQFLQMIYGLCLLVQSRILNHKMVKPYRTKKVTVLRAKGAAISLDGRLLHPDFPLKIEILPEAINFIIPK